MNLAEGCHSRRAPHDAQEDLLQEILRRRRIRHEPSHEVPQTLLMARDQLGESCDVALLIAGHESLVRHRRPTVYRRLSASRDDNQ